MMNVFISEMCKTMGISDTQKLNCSRTEGTIIDDSKVGFSLSLPDGTSVEVYTPKADSSASDMGYAYIPEYDQESPDMCAEDLGCWVDDCLDCSRRIDAYYESIKGRDVGLNSALEPELAIRVKDVFRAAQSAVDLPPGFRYTAFRENKEANLILSTLMYTSQKLGATQWVAKSSLTIDPIGSEETGVDDWAFEPNYNPDSEGHLIYHRAGRFIDVEQGMYGFTAEGATAQQRDKKTAYWLAGLLSDMVDSMLQNPPARCYEYFLADGIADLKKSDLDHMSTPGIMRLVTKGYVDAEKVLKAKPTLAKDLVQKGLITPEIVARRVPDRLLWLVQAGYITPDYAVKIDPTIKDKLVRKGLYNVAENVPDDVDAIIEGVKNGTFTATDAYRKNPKLLQPLVEQGLISPQEAYKLDASIVTWLLLNRYIGRAEAAKVKPDIQKYIARKYKDVNWEDLDASSDNPFEEDWEPDSEDISGELTLESLQKALANVIASDPDTGFATVKVGDLTAWVTPAGYDDNELILANKLDNVNVYVTLLRNHDIITTETGSLDKRMPITEAPDYIKKAAGESGDLDSNKDTDVLTKLREAFKMRQKAKRVEKCADKTDGTTLQGVSGLNSSLSFNSGVSNDVESESAESEVTTSEYGDGYQMLSETTAEGPGYVAEVMLPEDNFDGIIVPGDSEEIAKEILQQMLIANDGTFIDWKPVSDIQQFKAENPSGAFVVLN